MSARHSAVRGLVVLSVATTLALAGGPSFAQTDPRVREIDYDPRAVVSLPTRAGVPTQVQFDEGEHIAAVASGTGADCAQAEHPWCVAWPKAGSYLIVRPKSGAVTALDLSVVTDRRNYSLHFAPLREGDARQAMHRLTFHYPRTPQAGPVEGTPLAIELAPASESVQVARKLAAAMPHVVNARYSVAVGAASDDLVPTLVFDDGRFTYLRFAGNREVPALFQVGADGRESVVNARMQDDLLVVDRITARLVLRLGTGVVGVWNDAFDADGAAPQRGTTVPGVERVVHGAP